MFRLQNPLFIGGPHATQEPFRSPRLLAAYHPTRQRPSASLPQRRRSPILPRPPRRPQRGVRVTAYTLMSNHFHLVAIGDQEIVKDWTLKDPFTPISIDLRKLRMFCRRSRN